MTVRVTAVEVLPEYRLRLTFDDGTVTIADFSEELWGPLSAPLRDPEYFAMVCVDTEARTIIWPNGYDPSPEVLHGDAPAALPSRLRVKRISRTRRAS